MRWPPTSTRVGLGQLFCPSRAINVAAHRYDGRNLAQAFEYLGLADIERFRFPVQVLLGGFHLSVFGLF
jgi:hypothetical protein